MKRKLISLVLTVLLVFSMVPASLAATQYTLTMTPGSELSSVNGLAPLMEALALRAAFGEDGVFFSVLLSGNEPLSLALEADENALYATSTLLGGKTYYIGWDETIAIAQGVISEMELPEEAQAQVDQIIVACEELLASVRSGEPIELAPALTKPQVGVVTEEYIETINGILPGVGDALKPLMEKMATEEGEFAPEGCDPANKKVILNYTMEDLLPVFDAEWTQQLLLQALKQEYPDMPEATVQAMMPSFTANLKSMLAKAEMDYQLVCYLDGDELVSEEVVMTGDLSALAEEGEEVPEDMTLSGTVSVSRLTGAEGQFYTFDEEMSSMGVPVLVKGTALVKDAELLSLNGAMLVQGIELTAVFDRTATEKGHADEIALYVRTDAVSIIEPAASAIPVIVLKVEAEEVDDAALAFPDKTVAENILAQDFENLGAELSGNLTSLLFGLIGSVPSEAMPLVQSLLGQ